MNKGLPLKLTSDLQYGMTNALQNPQSNKNAPVQKLKKVKKKSN